MSLEIGRVYSTVHLFTQKEFNRFAALSGDDNPIHVDPAFAVRTRFGRTVAHGMLLYSVLCGLLSRHFPGARQIAQSFMFTAPTFTHEEVMFSAEVTAVDGEQIRLKTRVSNANGETTAIGETTLLRTNP